MRKLFEKKHDVDGIYAAIEAIAVSQGTNNKMEQFDTEIEVSIKEDSKVFISFHYQCQENEDEQVFSFEIKNCFDFENLSINMDKYWMEIYDKTPFDRIENYKK